MGNAVSSKPTIQTGRKVLEQKIEKAKKTGVLSLQEQGLDEVPKRVFTITTVRTLDLSKNSLTSIGNDLSNLVELKSLSLDNNKLHAGSFIPISKLRKLQSLSCGGNELGHSYTIRHGDGLTSADPLPSQLPLSLKQLKLDRNFLTSVPVAIFQLSKLEKLDLSCNQLAALPEEVYLLEILNELILDDNLIVGLPESVGRLMQLKTLSLKNNQISVQSIIFSDRNPQPIPKSLFTDTPLSNLNLHGNPMTNSQLNEFEGFPAFLERRRAIKSKDIYGGALTNLETCGLQ